MKAKIAFRLARLIVWASMFVAGAASGNRPLMMFGIGAGSTALVFFAIDAWREAD